MANATLADLLAKANQLRLGNQWQAALTAYQQLANAVPQSAEIAHNQAICYLGLNDAGAALASANRALAIKPDLWQSQLIKAKAERQTDKSGEDACATLGQLITHHPKSAEIQAHARLEMAELELNVFCNAQACAQWVKPVLHTPGFEERTQLTSLIAKLYDRSESDLALTQMAMDYAQRFLQQPGRQESNNKNTKAQSTKKLAPQGSKPHVAHKNKTASSQTKSGRKRIGLLSPMFQAGPLYFLTFASFKQLAKDHELILFSRGKKSDWATAEFQSIAAEWIDCRTLNHTALNQQLRDAQLDVLVELGGWMDTEGLKAVSTKPAPLQYKWVGGQAMTTGLNCFDGYLSDPWQTPNATHGLFTEPLILLPEGYVRFTPPGYFPKAKKKKAAGVAAIIGNPLKVTEKLTQRLIKAQREPSTGTPELKELRLIDRRYQHPRVLARIESLLESFPGKLKVVACDSHEEFLTEVAKVEWVVDTEPYSAGLTAREALALGAKLITPTRPGKLFASRHGWAANRAFQANSAPAPINLAELLRL